MPLHTKLFILSALLIFTPIALLLGDMTFLNCLDQTKIFPRVLAYIDAWVPLSLKAIPVGLGVLLVAFILEKKFHGKTIIRILFEVMLIGILTLIVGSLILASLNTARSKGPNAQVKSTMLQVRSSAEIYYDAHGNSYEGFCMSPELSAYRDSVKDKKYEQGLFCNASSLDFTCYDDSTAYALSVGLPNTREVEEAKYFCVDSISYASNVVKPITGTSCK